MACRGSYRLPGRRPAPRWRQRMHRVPGFSPFFRAGVLAVGAVLVVAGALLWVVSLLLCLPLVLAGLWTWSREFHWGSRLHRAVLTRAARTWRTARARPVRWSVATAGGLGCGAGLSWAAGHYAVVDRVLALAS